MKNNVTLHPILTIFMQETKHSHSESVILNCTGARKNINTLSCIHLQTDFVQPVFPLSTYISHIQQRLPRDLERVSGTCHTNS